MQINELLTKADLVAFEERLLEKLNQAHQSQDLSQRQWLRSKEVCQWLNISAGTLQNLRESGAIPYTRLGNTYFYPFSEIEKQLASNTLHRLFP